MHDEHPRQSNDAPGERRAYPLAPVTRAVARAIPARRIERGARRASRAPPGGRSTERCLNVSNRSETSPHASHVIAARTACGEASTRRAQRSMQRNRTGGTTGDGTAERRRWREVARRRERSDAASLFDALRVNAEPVAGVSRPSLNRSASGSRARPISDVVSIRSTAIFPSRYAAEISSSTASRHSHMNSCRVAPNPSNLARRRCTAVSPPSAIPVAPAARASSPRAPRPRARAFVAAPPRVARTRKTRATFRATPRERRDPRIVRETTYAAQYL